MILVSLIAIMSKKILVKLGDVEGIKIFIKRACIYME